MGSSALSAYSDWILIGLAVVVAGLIAWLVVLQIRLSRMAEQYARLMMGASGESLEQVLAENIAKIAQAVETASALDDKTHRIERTLKHSLQWLGIVRYNPFRDTGGAQSFALAIVDGNGDGVVLSSLHSRTNTRVYAKALSKWESQHSLTDEEKQAIERAYEQQT